MVNRDPREPLVAETVRSVRARFTVDMSDGFRRLFVLKVNLKS